MCRLLDVQISDVQMCRYEEVRMCKFHNLQIICTSEIRTFAHL